MGKGRREEDIFALHLRAEESDGSANLFCKCDFSAAATQLLYLIQRKAITLKY